MKEQDRVNTPDGPGIIIKKDLDKSKAVRFGVKLDVNKYHHPLAFYWPHELKKI